MIHSVTVSKHNKMIRKCCIVVNFEVLVAEESKRPSMVAEEREDGPCRALSENERVL